MKRKLVKQGHNALTVTLPSKWVKKFSLKGGDEINLSEEGKRIVISVDELGERKINFDMTGNSKYLYRFLGVLYRLGYDEIKINFQNPKIIDQLQVEIDNMLGYEILDQSENYCIVKSVAGILEKEFDSTLKRIFSMLIVGGDASLEILKRGEIKRLERIENIAKINNKLTNFCERVLNKFSYKEDKKTTLIYCMVWSIEQIMDEYKNIWEYLIKKNEEARKTKKPAIITEKEIKLYEEINSLIKEYRKIFYDFDADELSNLREKCLNFINNSREIFEEDKSTNKVILVSLHSIAEKIYHMCESLIKIE